jgi:hypothetical protein
MKLLTFTFLLAVFNVLNLQQVAADNCTFPGCFRLRINNCLTSEMTFVNCGGAVGKWIKRPTSIPPMSSTHIEIDPTGLFTPTVGNCTWTYHNNGTWVAFADWSYALLSGMSMGAGTEDEVNGELTQVGNYPDGNQCVWFYYASGTWDRCYLGTHDTECIPQS